MTSRIGVCNEFARPLIIWLEPWGEDYTLPPEEEVEIVAKDVDEAFHFMILMGEEVKIYAEGQVVDIGVYQNGRLLECGHNRIDK